MKYHVSTFSLDHRDSLQNLWNSNVNNTINQCIIWMTFQQMSSMKSLHLKSKLYICTFEGAIIILKQCKRRNRNKFPWYYILYVLRAVCNRFSHPKITSDSKQYSISICTSHISKEMLEFTNWAIHYQYRIKGTRQTPLLNYSLYSQYEFMVKNA